MPQINLDKEFNRLLDYCKRINVNVSFELYSSKDRIAGLYSPETGIVLRFPKSISKIQKVCILIHELAHHKGFIKNGNLFEDIDFENYDEEYYQIELKDSTYQEEVYREANCVFGINKLYAKREMQMWLHYLSSKKEKLPNREMCRKKRKELRQKYL